MTRCVVAFVGFWVFLLALTRALLVYEFAEHDGQRDASSGDGGK